MPTLAPVSPNVVPRVSTHAPYDRTFGQESVELYATTGQILDPWQAGSMDPMLAYRPGGKWTHFEHGEIVSRQNGKGCIGECRVLSGLTLFGDRLVMWSAHQYKTAKTAFKRIQGLVESSDELSRRIKKINNTHGEEGIEFYGTGTRRLTGTQQLLFIARSERSGRGMTGDCNVVDEAFALTFDQLGALLFTVSAVPNPQFLYLSSPPLATDQGEVLFSLRQRGESGEDPSLSWRDWGLAGDLANVKEIDLDDRALWYATNPSMPHRITEEQVERERRTLANDPETFARERLGVWPPAPRDLDGREISSEKWESLADAESKAGDDKVFVVDVSPQRDSSIGLFSPRGDGRGHIELIDQRPGTKWVAARLAELKAKHRPFAFGLDGFGSAASLLPDLKKVGIEPPEDRDAPRRGDLFVLGTADVASAFDAFMDAVDAGTPVHIDQVEMNVAVDGAKTRNIGDGRKAWARRTASANISPLVAVTNALWVYTAWADKVQPEEADPEAWWI